jgi:hypothetical protein
MHRDQQRHRNDHAIIGFGMGWLRPGRHPVVCHHAGDVPDGAVLLLAAGFDAILRRKRAG